MVRALPASFPSQKAADMARVPRGQQPLFEKKLFYGDNLRILRMAEHFPPESVDLVYLDPPFKPNEKYNVLFRDQGDAVPSASQVRAFEDTWRWGTAARDGFNDVKENSPHHVRETVEALHSILGFSNMFAYLAMMAPRLVEIHTVMKPTGSLYLHCDPAASHYLKVLLDSVFSPENFRNEIIWKRTATKGDARRKFGSVHDALLFYAKSQNISFSATETPHGDKYLSRFTLDDHDGRGPYEGAPLDSPNPRPNLTYEYKGYSPPDNGWRVSRKMMEALDQDNRLIFPKSPEGRIRLQCQRFS
jgi:site-specific DNA-methyltransferase (adenine-specific)